jgi:four helix bundle protein
MLKSYKDLTVWQKSLELVKDIYELTKYFPRQEIYGITNQIRRAAISIPSNIAEGHSRKYRQEYVKFIRIAFGSAAELETQLEIAKLLKLTDLNKFEKSDKLLNEVLRMLNILESKLSAKIRSLPIAPNP